MNDAKGDLASSLVATDEHLAKSIMGDAISRERSSAALSGIAGTAFSEALIPVVPKIWDRRVLPLRTTALVNLAILACLNRPHELRIRMVGLLRGGVSVAEIQEVLLHVGLYAGMPAGLEATVALHETIEDLSQRDVAFNIEPT
jgi:alkylhydroperoxidase/carboxymuconolactone decarboxylase family protein YurZ